MKRTGIAAATALVCTMVLASPARADLPAADTAWTEQSPTSTWFQSDLFAAAEVGDELWVGGYQGQVEVFWPPATWSTVLLRPPKPLLRRHSGGSWQDVDLPWINYGLIGDMAAVGPDDLWVLGARYIWGLGNSYLAGWDGSAWTPVGPPTTFAASDATLSPSGTLWLSASHHVANLVGSTWSIKQNPLPDYGYNFFIRSVTTAADRLWITGSYSDRPVTAFAAP